MNGPGNQRILLVDDNPSIHEDFRRVLTPEAFSTDIDSDAAALFGAPAQAPVVASGFELTSALQGQEACALTAAAIAAGQPYALAFVDMQMPPGWDGLVTIGKLWEIDPELNVVICTAHSDRSWEEIQTALPVRERWLVLKKPFDKIEVLQLAHALTEKWNLTQSSRAQQAMFDRLMEARTEQLRRTLQAKHESLANLTQDLMLPTNGLLGTLGLLAQDGVTEAGRSRLNDAHRAAENLLQLVRKIVTVNQAEAGAFALDPVDSAAGHRKE